MSVEFQHTAARRRLRSFFLPLYLKHQVSTHSHPKVAASPSSIYSSQSASFNTQPPEGGCDFSCFSFYINDLFQHTATRRWLQRDQRDRDKILSFNTQPPEGGCERMEQCERLEVCFNTQPPEGGCVKRLTGRNKELMFQHTATRRWLPPLYAYANEYLRVSTHSHPKVAASSAGRIEVKNVVSTHSHPKVAANGINGIAIK